jgi:aryl-alcohol dehydrogenase-like predicted oxidoreductase
VQTEYSLWTRHIEEEILPTCRELGIAFVPYSPLGRGFLTGRFKSPEDLSTDVWRHTHPRFQGENFAENLHLVGQVEAIADRKGITPAQVALAWVLAQGEDVIPIPGTKRVEYLEQNAAAAEVQLTRQDLEELGHLTPASGDRYPERAKAFLNG